MRPTLAFIYFALFSLLVAGSAAAQGRAVRPYFLFVVDTSGSMVTNNSAPANSCGFTGGNAASGMPTKLDAAKCALGKIINATGDADFGLMQFASGDNTSCNGLSTSKTCGTSGNLDCCGPNDSVAWLRVPIEPNSWQLILPLLDKQNSNSAPAQEMCAGGYTALGGMLIAAREYFQGTLGSNPAPTANDAALKCRPLSVILLTDGAECCDAPCMASWSDRCPKTIAHNPNAGVTCDVGCVTPVGDSSCSGASYENAPDRADELLHETTVPSANGTMQVPIRTYAIGFGSAVTPPNPRIEHIAIGGGTDNPDPNLRGFYASNEAQLSKALSQIIADAQPPAELCNNMDDDCDGAIDEGIPKYCDIPHGITDKTLCDPPKETVCDGKDDNCNGVIDEGLLNACKMCGDVPPEVCDGQDNDCDGRIDEDIASNACGMDMGICKGGDLQCISGKEQCVGGIGPQAESCNCQDDDCDGVVDEDTDNNLCPDGKCVGCTCIPRCQPGQEFEPACPSGTRPDFQPNGECLCVKDNCKATECSASTLKRDNEIACAPNDPNVTACVCRAGMCVALCDGQSCASGEICDKRKGRCVENNCRGLGCADGELCEPVMAQCMKDPCIGVDCQPDEACRMGKCERSCAAVSCNDGERCQGGTCVANACADVHCKQDEFCNPDNGKCENDQCSGGKLCGSGLVCAPSSGDCVGDPCFGVRCPEKQTCAAGECAASSFKVAPRPSHGSGSDPNARVVAAGGGGCSCRVTGGPAPANTGGAWGLALGLGLALVWRRRRAVRLCSPAWAALLGLFTLTGCRVDPFCIDCADAAHMKNNEDGGEQPLFDASTSREGGQSQLDAGKDARVDAAADAGKSRCKNPMPEICNGKDDDCDFKVDEDTVASVNNCDQFGVCAGTMPICVNGAFTCRYTDKREKDETRCDGIDSDCDGRVDETFSTLNDECDLGVGACKVTGKLVCNGNGDGVQCEAKTKVDPSDEVCDGIDNDCDGLVDEPRSNPGSAPSFVVDDAVQVNANLWVYKYEASRPDATSSDQGIIGVRACSKAGVLPWTNLTYTEAKDACAAAGMELCKLADWITTCTGTDNCAWSYTPAGGSCPSGSAASYPMSGPCNGHDQSAQPGSADHDALAPTGSMARCFTNVQGGQVFDVSGNAKEWTTGPDSPDTNPLRGGSYNNLPGGMRCDFDFNLGSATVRLPNVGFRCCSASQP